MALRAVCSSPGLPLHNLRPILIKQRRAVGAACFAASVNRIYVNGTLFFGANDGIHGWELWKSDGTDAGTTMIADMYAGPGLSERDNMIGLNESLYFTATGPDGRRALWRSDGMAAGTQPVRADCDIGAVEYGGLIPMTSLPYAFTPTTTPTPATTLSTPTEQSAAVSASGAALKHEYQVP